MTRERQAVHDRLDLAVGEFVGVAVVHGQQLGCEVVAWVVDLGGHEVAAVAPVGQHLVGDLHLLGLGGLAPAEGQPVRAPLLELLVVAFWEADEAEDRLARQLRRRM